MSWSHSGSVEPFSPTLQGDELIDLVYDTWKRGTRWVQCTYTKLYNEFSELWLIQICPMAIAGLDAWLGIFL